MIFNNGWTSCPYCGGCFDTAGKCLKCGQYPPQEGVSLNNSTATQVQKIFDEAVQESINKAIGADIKQAWQNGYKKGKSDTVKEFADKLRAATDKIMDTYGVTEPNLYTKVYVRKPAVLDCINELAAEYGVEVEK